MKGHPCWGLAGTPSTYFQCGDGLSDSTGKQHWFPVLKWPGAWYSFKPTPTFAQQCTIYWARPWLSLHLPKSLIQCLFGITSSISPPFFLDFGATSEAYRGSQARSWIRTRSANLHHSHSYAGSKPHLRPTPQQRRILNPLSKEPEISWFLVGFLSTAPWRELLFLLLLNPSTSMNKSLNENLTCHWSFPKLSFPLQNSYCLISPGAKTEFKTLFEWSVISLTKCGNRCCYALPIKW